ncbi:MAG: trehalose-phosphatase [Phenylobacterium sp.]|uniref:trehalose-phosphatase n=1 Tax=Phenylobacterium sp. TaxID=1871053 RepID=UPI00391B3A72
MIRPIPLIDAACAPAWPARDRMALFLDLDGTLAPIETEPQAVGPQAGRNALLARVSSALGGRTAIVSGRTVADIDRILEGRIAAVAGVHGLERRTAAGEFAALPPHPALGEARRAMLAFASADRGLEVEDKALSVALHYRRAPGASEAVRDLGGRLSAALGLARQDGDCVVELRTPGPTKGDAVMSFMAEAPFEGGVPVFVGDDLTDEDAFAAVAAAGGFGVLVGPLRETRATHRLGGVDQVLAWLDGLAQRAGAQEGAQ